MNELTFKEIKSEIRVSHRVLAEHLGLRQDAVRKLIEGNTALFEQISACPFQMEMVETGSGAQRETKVSYLDSDQANFLIGLTRPTEDTLPLKLKVVLGFKKAKEQLANKSPMRIPQTLEDVIAALRTELLAKEQIPSTPLEAATKAADSELALRHSLWKKLGLKKIDRDVESIEVLRRIEHDHMVTGLVPASLANRVAKMDPTTKKVVETALSGKHVRPIRLAGIMGYRESTQNAAKINSALCAMGLQMRHITNNSAFMPINAGVNIANVDDVGSHKGVLVGWEPVKTVEVLEEYFSRNKEKSPV